MYSSGNLQNVIREPIFAPKNFWNLDENHGRVSGAPLEPHAAALNSAGAPGVDLKEFRTLDVDFALARPSVNRDFLVWELPGRRARAGKECREWRLGEWPQRIYGLSSAPPRIRKAAFREVIGAHRCKGQVGWPPSVATDARLGFSAMAYQLAEFRSDSAGATRAS